MMELRDYQQASVDAVWAHVREHETNPAVVLPTGSGKTHVIARLCSDAVAWGGRVIVLAHVKELLEQAADKLRATAPGLPVGIFSAGLGRRDIGYPVTIAGIQSVYERAHELGPLDLVIVDEAHLIPPDGDGMYRRFLSDARAICPHQRVIGLTATPYRSGTGEICGPAPEHVLNTVCHEVGVRDLIDRGFLCPLRSRAGKALADISAVAVRGGEFVADALQDAMDDDALVRAACADIVASTADRRSVLLFCSGVRHCEHVVRILSSVHGVECGMVDGSTESEERDAILTRFKDGSLRYLANVNVLTTGFDAPNIDCVVMLRPTMSPGLYYQMAGRGFRIAPGKEDCLVLDFGGNVLRHGPVDAIRLKDSDGPPGEPPAKQCPACDALIHTAYAKCPHCGHAFPPRKVKHDMVASEEQIVSGADGPRRSDERVIETTYHLHVKRGDPQAIPTLRVDYRLGFNRWVREWVCIEHPPGSYPHRKAKQWWDRRCNDPMPSTVEDALFYANAGGLSRTERVRIETKPGDGWERVVGHELGEKPPRVESNDGLENAPGVLMPVPDDGIPF